MLPSRLFRNTGLPPALRSLITPKATLPALVKVQLHLRLAVNPSTLRNYSSSSDSTSGGDGSSGSAASSNHSTPLPPPPANKTPSRSTTTSQALPQKMEPRLAMTFTCTVKGCGERSTHEFTKRAYEKGIVLVQCPGCKNRHLIADHLGWFKESTSDGKLKTVEDLLRAKGEKVQRGRVNMDGDVEYVED